MGVSVEGFTLTAWPTLPVNGSVKQEDYMEEPVDQAQNEPVVEANNPSETPTDEPKTSSQSETGGEAENNAQINEPAAEEPKSEDEHKPSRAEKRIRQLTDQVKQVSQSNQPAPQFGQSPQLPQYEPGAEIPQEQLQADVVQTAQAIAGQTVQAVLSQEKAKNNFEVDRANLEKHPLLDEKSSEYLPEVEKAISEEFEQRAFRVVGYDPFTGQPITVLDPSVRLSDIAKRHLGVAEAAVKKSGADMKNAVARSADETAIKPGSTTKGEKRPEDMSIAEMEAKYGFAQR